MIKNLRYILLLTIFASCKFYAKKPKDNLLDEKIKMLDADKAFSQLSEEKGMKTAFMEYIDSNGVLLRPNEMPIIGANAIDYLSQQNDKDYTLIWEPRGGDIAKSGEMGFTYGIYSLKPKTADTTIFGTYVSIWKKQADGTWRFVLDSGNEGLNIEEVTQEQN